MTQYKYKYIIKWVKWLNYLFFRIFVFLLLFITLLFICILYLYCVRIRGALCCRWHQVDLPPLKCQFSIPLYWGVKIRYFKESNSILDVHFTIIIIFSNTESKLQFTLLHQRFICYWHIELVNVVEIYIAPTFHIILQSL